MDISFLSNGVVALCGVRDAAGLAPFLHVRNLRVVPWSPRIRALLIDDPAEDAAKLVAAKARGIPVVPTKVLRDCSAVGAAGTELWTEKYRPTRIADVVGNVDAIAVLRDWIRRFAAAAARPSGKEAGALVTGPPGIGKTTAVLCALRDAGFEVIEMNASDERSASAVKRFFADAAGNTGMGSRPRAVVMDEVDGMSSGDRGGIGELAKVISSATFPIICIANERTSPRIRPLAGVCIDIRFARPYRATIVKALMGGVVAKERLKIRAEELDVLCERNGNDIRQLLNFLQFGLRASSAVAVASAAAATKDEVLRIDPFSAGARLLGGGAAPPGSIDDRMNLVFVDHGLVPLMVGEGYIAAAAAARGVPVATQLERIANASDHLVAWDVLDRRIHRTQAWGLLPAATLEIVSAAAAAGGQTPPQFFPSWLGKNSKRLKHRRLLADMRSRLGTTGALGADELELLRMHLFKGAGDAKGVVGRLRDFGLSREDMMETLVETTFKGFEDAVSLDTKLKAAITREWNKTIGNSKATVGSAGTVEDDVADLEEEEEETTGF
jgi:replication factor C subunit 1